MKRLADWERTFRCTIWYHVPGVSAFKVLFTMILVFALVARYS